MPVAPAPEADVCAASVCLANCSIISIGFSTDAIGDTKSPVGIGVAVSAGGGAMDLSHAETTTAAIVKTDNINTLR
ncbi:MAG: hypothetical protein AMXMBFR60_03370 [Chloroflexota bacterium]